MVWRTSSRRRVSSAWQLASPSKQVQAWRLGAGEIRPRFFAVTFVAGVGSGYWEPPSVKPLSMLFLLALCGPVALAQTSVPIKIALTTPDGLPLRMDKAMQMQIHVQI